jgi:tetratricopeptide (TPR) repeat protein
MRLAWAHFFREEIVEAGLRLDQARAKLDPKDPWPRLLEAHLASRAGRSEQAEQALDAFFAAGGEDFDARMMQVAFHRRAGRKAEYVAALEKARACWPPSPAPLAQLRTFYMTEGREAEALKMLEEQARLASTSVPLRLQLAREYVARNRDADAMRVLEEAMFVTPFHREVHELALPLYREAGERKKAVRAARCLVALRAEDDTEEEQAARWLTLADVLLEDGQKEEAGAAVREAQRLAPEEHAERREELKKKLGQ